jgi:hypothetical protein
MQQTCTFYHNPVLVDKVVTYYIDNVYGTELTVGIIKTAAAAAAAATTNTTQSDTDDSKITQKGGKKNHHHPRKMGGKGGSKGKNSLKALPPLPPPPPPAAAESNGTITNTSTTDKYTLEHLRSIELTVVARVLSLPEPKTGFYVSKSWIKKTLLWLEKVNDPNDGAMTQHSSSNNKTKKLSKKQQRQRNRRYVSACVAVCVVHAVV